jgi:NAD+ kinase
MKTVAIVSKPDKPELAQIVAELMEWLRRQGCDVVIDSETATYVSLAAQGVPRERLAEHNPDMLIVLGGDGTLLSAARAVAPLSTSILGVNLGSLGFLTEVPLEELYPTLAAVHGGEGETDDRSMLRAMLVRDGEVVSEHDALNDVILSKSMIARLVSFEIFIDKEFVSTYRGDGLIIAAPTGSTAYSLAAGGPILTPSVAGLVISPICPHALTHRPVVVPDTVEIEILVKNADEEAFLSIDGQIGIPVLQGDRLVCRKSPYVTHLLRLRKTFFEVLRTKLKWGSQK